MVAGGEGGGWINSDGRLPTDRHPPPNCFHQSGLAEKRDENAIPPKGVAARCVSRRINRSSDVGERSRCSLAAMMSHAAGFREEILSGLIEFQAHLVGAKLLALFL